MSRCAAFRRFAPLVVLLGCRDPGADSQTSADDTGDSGVTEGCTYLTPDTRLVLADGCVDGVCGGADYAAVEAAWGAPDRCVPTGVRVTCTWAERTVEFTDCDHDSAPDTGGLCDQFDQTFIVSGAWDGASAEGLGLGVPLSCWEATLGPMPERGWEYGSNPWVYVTVSATSGAVDSAQLAWQWDE